MDLEEAKEHLDRVQTTLQEMRKAHLTATPKYKSLLGIEKLLKQKIELESK